MTEGGGGAVRVTEGGGEGGREGEGVRSSLLGWPNDTAQPRGAPSHAVRAPTHTPQRSGTNKRCGGGGGGRVDG